MGGSSLHLPLDQFQTTVPRFLLAWPRSPRKLCGSEALASNNFLGLSSPDSTPGSSQFLPSFLCLHRPLTPALCLALCWALGTRTRNRHSFFTPRSPLSLISAQPFFMPSTSQLSHQRLETQLWGGKAQTDLREEQAIGSVQKPQE